MKANCGQYLSYASDCNNQVLDMWPQAGENQKFNFVKTGTFEWYIEAVGRSQCDYRWASFPVDCTTNSPDKIDLWKAAGTDQRFRIHPVRNSHNPLQHNMNSDFGCADPYMWWSDDSSDYKLMCTGGNLGLASVKSPLSSSSVFSTEGSCLGGAPAQWASESNRWAPENYQSGNLNYAFFSDSQNGGAHRIGWAASDSGVVKGAYDTYSNSYMQLGGAAGGDIDQHIFADDNGKTYMVWKTDDNAVGSLTTRIFMQEIVFGNNSVSQVGAPTTVMDSTGLWWADSWVDGGSLIEGPEIVKHNGWYYLFFASGKYCQDSYAEGVARSTNIWGPYDKLEVPVLSTGIVGNAAGGKLVGPGHASIVADHENKDTFWLVYHASVGENCNRFPFIDQLKFGDDGWPYVAF